MLLIKRNVSKNLEKAFFSQYQNSMNTNAPQQYPQLLYSMDENFYDMCTSYKLQGYCVQISRANLQMCISVHKENIME